MTKPIVITIFNQLLYNKEYFTKCWPYMDKDYFDGASKAIFIVMKKLVDEYKVIPSKNSITVMLEESKLPQTIYNSSVDFVNQIEDNPAPEDLNWLLDATENYIKNSALFNATSKAIEIQTNAKLPKEQRDNKLPDVGVIPELMKDALSISFDSDIGHDWLGDYETRWLHYQTKADKVPFSLNILNTITKGGAEKGTLNVLLMPTNVGKSLGLCSLAADYLLSGKNVVYISMEMSEIVCAKRIDANLLDISLDDLDKIGEKNSTLSFQEFKNKMENINSKSVGRLKIKQYPTGHADVNNFRAFLNELKIKDNFIPEVIMIDYLGICASSRIKSFSENSYTLVKAIAEELRGLAVEAKAVMWSAAQTTRGAWDASDISMGDVAESAGLAHTVDFLLGGIETDEHKAQGVQMFKQLKSRYGNKDYYGKFNMGVKKENQRWYEIEESIQEPTTPQGNSTRSKINDLNLDDMKF